MTKDLLQSLLQGNASALMGGEEMAVEVLRDLVREELRKKVQEALDKNPELREELREAVRIYFEAKVHEAYASLKFAKVAAKLGIEVMPEKLRDELAREVAGIIEREVGAILDRTL